PGGVSPACGEAGKAEGTHPEGAAKGLGGAPNGRSRGRARRERWRIEGQMRRPRGHAGEVVGRVAQGDERRSSGRVGQSGQPGGYNCTRRAVCRRARDARPATTVDVRTTWAVIVRGLWHTDPGVARELRVRGDATRRTAAD